MPPREDKFFPPVGAPEGDILRFRDRMINRWSIYRNMHMGSAALWIWYYLGRHWSQLDFEASFDGVRGSILRDMDYADLPRPVTNEIDPAVEQEVINQVMNKWTPKHSPKSSDPKIKAAAQVATDSLNYRLEKLCWPEKSHQHSLYFTVSGTGLLYTADDPSYNQLKTVGSQSAVWCQSCGTKLYSQDIPNEFLGQGYQHPETGANTPVAWADSAKEVPPDESETEGSLSTLAHCPCCVDSANPLTPYNPTPEEADTGTDIFGRPLGEKVPCASSIIEVDLPFEFYPQDGGVRKTPDTLHRWGRRKIRSMEWGEERFPHAIADVDADPIAELLYGDPMLGEWAILGTWSPSLDSGILDNHFNCDELVELPTFRYPLGRYVIASKSVVLLDTDLLACSEIEGDKPGETEEIYVPRAQISAARFKIRPGEFWGTGLPEIGLSPQNRLNGLDAEMIEGRDRMGPYIAMTPGMWVEGPSMELPGVGKVLYFQPDPGHPDILKPEVFQGPTMPPETYQERTMVQSDLHRLMGPTAASIGAPSGIGTTSGVQLQIEQDKQARSLREEELTRSVQKGWSHLNQLQWVLHLDQEETYEVMGPNDVKKVESYRGSALRGQFEVTIEKQPFIALSIVNREAAREALADKVIVIDSPMTRKRLADLYGVPNDLNADTNNQISQAERQWTDFIDKGIIPTQDPIDDAAIRYQVLGAYLLTEQSERLAEAANWNNKLRMIAGWEQKLGVINQQEQKSIAFYGERLVGADAAKAFATATIAYDRQKALYAQQQEQYAQAQQLHQKKINDLHGAAGNDPALQQAAQQQVSQLSAQPPAIPQPIPPTPPPPPLPNIPVLLQDRIYMIWNGMITTATQAPPDQAPPPDQGIPQQPAEPPDPLEARFALPPGPDDRDPDSYMRFRALVEAYHLTATGMSTIPLPAPGSGATMAPVDQGSPAGVPGQAGQAPQQAQPQSPNPTAPMPGGGAS